MPAQRRISPGSAACAAGPFSCNLRESARRGVTLVDGENLANAGTRGAHRGGMAIPCRVLIVVEEPQLAELLADAVADGGHVYQVAADDVDWDISFEKPLRLWQLAAVLDREAPR
jgi:hypothetical protein